jgi:EAL domain-containing protein (putative c-di-GMP-specific phosphodiesterase class I)
MQNTFARNNHLGPESPEPSNVKPVAEIEGAIREFVRQDMGNAGREPKDAADTAANVNSLVQRGISLRDLQSLIGELQQLHDFLQSEGERLEREIAEYAQLTKSTKNSTRLVADNMLHWKRTSGD